MARVTRESKLLAVPAPASIHSAVLQAALDAVVVMDERGIIVEMNGAAERMFGYAATEAVGQNLAELIIPQAMRERHAQGLARFLATGKARVLGQRLQLSALRRGGEEFPVELAIAEISGSRGGRLFAGYVRDLTARLRDEALRAGHGRALEMIASSAPLRGTLEAIVRTIEDCAPEVRASILLLDADGVHVRHGATGRLPRAFWSAIDGEPIGPRAGSCGSAMHRREPVIVEDIDTDPLWTDYRKLASAHGLRACWSTPIFDPQRRVLGSFALYVSNPARPDAWHFKLIEIATGTAAIAIQRDRSELERRRLLGRLDERIKELSVLQGTAQLLQNARAIDQALIENLAALLPGGWQHPEICRARVSLDGVEAATPGWRESRWMHSAPIMAEEETAGSIDIAYIEEPPGAADRPFLDEERKLLGSVANMLGTQLGSIRAQAALRNREAMFRSIFDNAAIGMTLVDMEQRFARCNAALGRMLGYGEEEISGKTIADLTHPEDVDANRDSYEALAAGRIDSFQLEKRYLRKDGGIVWGHVTVSLLPSEAGAARRTIGMIEDITERKKSDEELHRFRAAMDASGDAILLVSRNLMRYVDVNQTFCDLVGYSREELLGMTPMELFSADRETLERDYDSIIADNNSAASKIEGQYRRKDGTVVPIETRRRALHTKDGWIIVGTARDITERKQAEERISYLATHDGLTGLPNRNLMQDRIQQAIAHARRAGRQLALLYLDLDRFKVMNDGYGHPFGDAVLRAVGARLAALVRESDTVARHGGDEFLILLADLRKAPDAYVVAQKIIEGLDTPFDVEGRQIHLSGSIGVSVFPQDGETPETLISNADVAMYRAKELGRNTYQFFTREMSEETQRRVDLETRLRGAAEAGQLQLAYQPKVNLEDGSITGCEALLRWNLPGTGPVSPARFIPIAEDSGLIVPIGDWVLRTACVQNKAWLDAGLPPVTVAVNISARQFLQQDVVAWVMRTLEETGLPPAQLELELTESLIAQDVEKVIATVNELKAAGVKLAIDDFGTGYSSLSYLKRFRVDTLKIDQSFVRNMLTEMDDATIVLAVISLAHNLKFKVVAEGVETHEHYRFLRLNRCDEMQGYYFSKPAPAAEMEAMLRAGKRLA